MIHTHPLRRLYSKLRHALRRSTLAASIHATATEARWADEEAAYLESLIHQSNADIAALRGYAARQRQRTRRLQCLAQRLEAQP